jgi:uncharacterized protein involved in outer membrane biogenesis
MPTTFTGERIVRDETLPITKLTTHVKLTDGVLRLDPLNFGLAGGNLVSTIQLDGKREPMAAMIDMHARHLQIRQLFPKIESMHASVGEVNGGARLTATGNSVAALLGSANGEARLLVENGTVSKFILEAIGLNVGSVVISKLFGDKPVQINCGVSAFGITNGVAQAQTFVLDTQDAVITTEGAIDFKDEELALTIHPDSGVAHPLAALAALRRRNIQEAVRQSELRHPGAARRQRAGAGIYGACRTGGPPARHLAGRGQPVRQAAGEPEKAACHCHAAGQARSKNRQPASTPSVPAAPHNPSRPANDAQLSRGAEGRPWVTRGFHATDR